MTDQVYFEVFGNLGVITLNRPKALNALTLEMCEAITRVLIAWQDDERIGAVLIEGAGERAFCAGGDIIMLYESGRAGDGRAEAFWRAEYALNELIHRYKKPYIALIDGIVMGGGVGLSVHGRYRVCGDTTLFAMPETGIGYFPDVGGTYFLPRLGRALGNWLGLTGARLKTAQTFAYGIANLYVPSAKHEQLKTALGKTPLDGSDAMVENVLNEFSQKLPLPAPRPDALEAFAQDSVFDILSALQSEKSEWSQTQIQALLAKSPFAVMVTFEALRRGAQLDFKGAMRQELDLSLNFLKTPDFYEGVRAAVIDKDRNPKWKDKGIEDVCLGDIEQVFTSARSALTFIGED